jgi:hypothetical protein
MNIHNDNFNSNNNSLSLSFSGKGLNDTYNSLNNYLKTGIGFQLLSNNSNYKEFVIGDTSNINSNYFASLRIAVEKSQISLKSITSNNIIQPLIINSNIYITSNIGIGKTNPIFDIDVNSNINADNYFIKGLNISNIFTTSNLFQTSIQNLSNLTNYWTKSTSTIIYTNSNVGINKSNPSYNLDVAGNINFTGNLTKNGIIFNNFSGNYEDLLGKPNKVWDLIGNDGYNLNIGNIGINSSVPKYRLDVNGDINFTGKLLKNKVDYSVTWNSISGANPFARVATTGSYYDLIDYPTSTGGLSGLIINWTNIQQKPEFAKIATSGSWIDLNDKPNFFNYNYSSLINPPYIAFNKIGETTNIYNINAGNVGIKNQNPTSTLDVIGDIRFTGNLIKGSITGASDKIYGTDWSRIEGAKPIFHRVAESGSFEDLILKPQYYTTRWGLIEDKPTIFDLEWTSIRNTPLTFNTTWEKVQGRPAYIFSGRQIDLLEPFQYHPIAFSGEWSDLENAPNIEQLIKTTINYYDIENAPIPFSEDFNDLKNLPDFFNSNYSSLIGAPYIAFDRNIQTNNVFTKTGEVNNVGINNTVPTYKLDVNGDINISTGYTYKLNGNTLTNSTATFSDYRIKKNITNIDNIKALDLINKIKPKNYNYIDIIEQSSNNAIGFIAQQIKDIIPDAVNINEEFIPNIYKYYKLVSSNSILVDDDNINKIFIGNTIKLIVNKLTVIVDVLEKTDNIIKINNEIDVNANCMIYGIKVNDFHFIDKTYIYTLNVCATQEIYKQLEEQKKEIEELKLAISKIIS